MEQFDRFGSMTTGKKLSTEGLPAGNYRLLVTATDPETQHKIFGSLTFHITSSANPASWNTYDDSIPAQYAKGNLDLMRGNALLAMGRREEALSYIERAYQKNIANENARDTLADLYFEKAGYDNVIQLYGKGGINQHTSDTTVLNFAQSFAKTGKLNSAVDVLESALTVKTPSEPLYLALVSYYDQMGNATKSAEVKKKMETIRK
jgi:tetratricopeptide (TPR) repeat protein